MKKNLTGRSGLAVTITKMSNANLIASLATLEKQLSELKKLIHARVAVPTPTVAPTDIDTFWKTIEGTEKPSQLQRYEQKNSPDGIKKFIAIGGGGKMGSTMEQFARFRFNNLLKRDKGKEETGYDHIIKIEAPSLKKVLVEQKSSGHWGDDDYKWQHVEDKHKWNMLLLCGIDYTDVKFWAMDRKTFNHLISDGKITNQGNKTGESSEGRWFNYSDVKDSLVEIKTGEDLLQFASSLEVAR